jgi:hypothetical protein
VTESPDTVEIRLWRGRIDLYWNDDDPDGPMIPCHSLTWRGAQREITMIMANRGYIPAQRWQPVGREWTRIFRKRDVP